MTTTNKDCPKCGGPILMRADKPLFGKCVYCDMQCQLPPAQGWWLVSDIPEDTIDTYG
jgi:hypothetical protein